MSVAVKRAVITGGGSGLGRSLALELARRGADVLVADIQPERVGTVAGEVTALGRRGVGATVDVRDPGQMESLLRRAVEELGGLDLWVNNAGVAVAGDVGDVPLEDWRWVMEVNLWGVIHGCQVAVPWLKRQGHGWLLNVASAAGLLSTPGMAPYNVSKAGVVSLSETLNAELSQHGVGVTVLCPTFFQTDLLNNARSPDPARLRLAGRLMRRSALTADDVARRGLDDLLARRLYSLPMADGRTLWRVRRAFPELFYRLLPRAAEWMGRR